MIFSDTVLRETVEGVNVDSCSVALVNDMQKVEYTLLITTHNIKQILEGKLGT